MPSKTTNSTKKPSKTKRAKTTTRNQKKPTKKVRNTPRTKSKSKKPRVKTVTKEVIREVPVLYTGARVPFMPFPAVDTGLATNNLLGYLRGMIDLKHKNVPRIHNQIRNPFLVPTNTHRSRRRTAPPRLHGDRNVAQQIVDDHFARSSRFNDTNTSVFQDLRRDMGVIPRRINV